MIISFRDKRTRIFFEGERVKAFQGFERQAMLRLDRLHAADRLRALNTPGNRLEGLKGDRQGQYSIRINDQWRICFEWPEGSLGPLNVEIVDYH
jgi:proteic killer suppression protein